MGEKEYNPRSVDAMLAMILAEQERTNRTLEVLMRQHEEVKARVTSIEMAYQRVIGMSAGLAAVISLAGTKLWDMLTRGS
jgi:hypothetical protein